MSRSRFLAKRAVKTSLWFIPVMCLLAGIVTAIASIAVDRATGGDLIPSTLTGDPNAAVAILSTTAASMVSLTALVLTITGVVVQLAMGQFSPRSVRPFLQDRPSQFAIGVFVGAFAHSVLALREVRSFGDTGYVPSLTITISFVLILVSAVVLVAYVHHIGNSLKVDSIISSVGDETRNVIESLFPRRVEGIPSIGRDVISSDRVGFVFDVDIERIVGVASDADARIEMIHPLGTFVPLGAPIANIVHDDDGEGAIDTAAVKDSIAIGPERTMDRDVAFGLQTLVDIAQRSLTDSFNDPTTAAQAIDRIHDSLRLLASVDLEVGKHHDAAGTLRLVIPSFDWDDYVAIAIDPVLQAGAASPQVLERIEAALHDLRSCCPPDRRSAIEQRLDELAHHQRERRSA